MVPKGFVYELPEDYDLSDEHREKLDSLLEKLDVTDNDLAQELIDLHIELVEETLKNFQF